MRTVVALIAAAMLFVSLTGCAATSASSTAKVKCPACGHEFTPAPVGP